MTDGTLTQEQAAIADTACAARTLVTAGPGTGKTHTLVARLSNLVDVQQVPPGGVLVLSFSRAAVGELRKRLRDGETDASAIVPLTFDSFATQLLSRVDPDGAWTEESFDGRIRHAIDRIDDIAQFLSETEHICIDELQDLVGVRMRFVQVLLTKLDCGFTLLGDPAQGIYDFSLGDDETPENDGSPALYAFLRAVFSDVLTEHRLTQNHRAKTDRAKSAALLGAQVVDDPETASLELLKILENAPRLASLTSIDHLQGRTALLCRNNGQALWVSRALHEAGVQHQVQRGAQSRVVAPWLAEVCRVSGGGILSMAKLTRILEELDSSTDLDVPLAEEVFRPLRKAGKVDNAIDLDKVTRTMRTRGLPEDLDVAQDSLIRVSTVHRSKGLEFDNVVVVTDAAQVWDPPLSSESTRELFVALTRTISGLCTVELPELVGRLSLNKSADRWSYVSWKKWPKAMAITAGDICRTDPFGGAGAAEIQQLIRGMRPGQEIELRFVRPRIGEPGAIYDAVVDGVMFGRMSEGFEHSLLRTLRSAGNNWKYPKRIVGLRVDAVGTVGGDPMITNQAGLGTGGAWLVPSLVGFGEFEYDWENT